jgi:hypothetical protein
MPEPTFSFTAFLSHRYKSPRVNLFFFELFSKVAEVQFEVDEGKGDLNVTRLECMLRDADAFIGIYPFAGTPDDLGKPDALKKLSKYFRLEIDLAVRSQKPAIIFYDKRYDDLLKPPPGIISSAFDFFEITGEGGSPQAEWFSKLFTDFSAMVKHRMALNVVSPKVDKSDITLILGQQGSIYSGSIIEKITDLLSQSNYDTVRILRWPPVLDRTTFRQFNESKLVLIDFSPEIYNTGINSFLHGRFIPMIRLLAQTKSDLDKNTIGTNFLFGGLEAGYSSDLVVWDNEENLLDLLRQRLSAIKRSVKRINNFNEAKIYFESDAPVRRNEQLFISYSGEDIVFTKELSNLLKGHFDKIFDYKDGDSISVGEHWSRKIRDELSKTDYVIPLFSSHYLLSKNCRDELKLIEEFYKEGNGTLKILPFILEEPKELEHEQLPDFISALQYKRVSAFKSVEEIKDKILRKISTSSS